MHAVGRIRLLPLLAPLLTGCLEHTDLPVAVLPVSAIQLVGTSDLLSRIVDLVPMDDGSVWILNGLEPFFIHLSSEGTLLEAVGRSGQGPGEFAGPTTLFGVPGPRGVTAWSYDPRAHGLTQPSLRPVSPSHSGDGPWPEVGFTIPPAFPRPDDLVSLDDFGMGPGRPWIRALSGPAFLLAVAPGAVRGSGRFWSAEIIEFQPDGTVEHRLQLSEYMVGDLIVEQGVGALLMGPQPLWALCPDERLLIYDPATNRVLTEGRISEGVVLPPVRSLSVTADRVFHVLQERETELSTPGERMDSVLLRRAFELDFERFRSEVSPVFAEYAEFHCLAQGEFWLRLVDPDRSVREGHRWYRVHGGGVTLVEFPPFFEARVFAQRKVWGVHRDAVDTPYAAWIDLDRELQP